MPDALDPIAILEGSFRVDPRAAARTLALALDRKAEWADLFFETTEVESLKIEEGLVKKASRQSTRGVGVRVVAGERTGYSYTEDLDPPAMRAAALAAREIAEEGPGATRVVSFERRLPPRPDLYPCERSPVDHPVGEKAECLRDIDRIARRFDPRITNVIASLVTQWQVVVVAGSEGWIAADRRPLFRIHVECIATDRSGRREEGSHGGGGRAGLDRIGCEEKIEKYATQAARQAIVNLAAIEAPAGEMDVVLGPGWPGVLLHEAVGHGLEGDFHRKGTSAFSGRMGQKVASPLCTVVDDGTIPGRRGSINIDDEGTPSQRSVLIEKGILRGYMLDKLNARLMGLDSTGNGRRESYAHIPIPRMRNTILAAGEDDPEEIVRSVRRGLYAVSFGGGQVDIVSGRFVFSASEAYLIEDGRLGPPVRGATLIGSGPDVLTRVSRVGCDSVLDEGVGTCGKDGQGVPVGVGMPTVRLDGVTVGGTRQAADGGDGGHA